MRKWTESREVEEYTMKVYDQEVLTLTLEVIIT